MLQSFMVLLVCQAGGEAIHRLTGLPLSGPITGMVILLGVMIARRGPSPELRNSSNALLGYLSLLFVPAAVGIMPHLAVLRAQWLPVVVALLVSTFLGMGTAGLVVQAMNRRARVQQTPQAQPPAVARLEQAGGAGD
jgi:holin-like protein